MPDRVDCAHLADNAVVLERVYPRGEMPRLLDLLADARVSLRELAEEELLLALPIVARHAAQSCGRAPTYLMRRTT